MNDVLSKARYMICCLWVLHLIFFRFIFSKNIIGVLFVKSLEGHLFNHILES